VHPGTVGKGRLKWAGKSVDFDDLASPRVGSRAFLLPQRTSAHGAKGGRPLFCLEGGRPPPAVEESHVRFRRLAPHSRRLTLPNPLCQGLIECSGVWSVECGVWSAECGV